MTCKSGAPTQDGSRSSSMRDPTSRISKTIDAFLSLETKILKVELLASQRD
jgi:hypothetical protein